MKNFIWPLLGLGIGLGSAVTPAVAIDYKPFVEFSSFSHSEPIAVQAILNDWNAPLNKGNLAFSLNRAEVGIASSEWQFSVFERQDYLFEFTSDSAKLLYQTNNEQDFTVGEQYDLRLKTNSFIARGLKLGYQKPFAGFNIGLAISYLEGLDITDGSITGQATATANNQLNFDFDVDYYYTEDTLFERNIVSKPKGSGYGLDLSVDGFVLPAWYTSLKVQDLFAQIHWWDTPRTIAQGNYIGEDVLDLNSGSAPINGTELNNNYVQKIPTKVFWNNQYALSRQHFILADYYDYSVKQFYSIGYRFVSDSQFKIDVLYNATAGAWKVGYTNNWLEFNLISDQFEFEKARTLGLYLVLNYKF